MKHEVEPANVNQEDLKNIDRLNYTTIKEYDIHVRQQPSARQRRRKVRVLANTFEVEYVFFRIFHF